MPTKTRGQRRVTDDFDAFAAEYPLLYNSGWWREYRRRAFSLVHRVLPRRGGLRVLDLGGGALLSLPDLLLDPRVERYIVVDLVDHLPRDIPKVEFVQGDILSYVHAYEGAPFDAVIIFGVLMYLPADDVGEVLRCLPRLMTSQAVLLVHEPTRRACRYLTPIESPVDVVAEARVAGLPLKSAENYNVPAIRRVVRRMDSIGTRLGWSPFGHPKTLAVLLVCERWTRCGVDGLYTLGRSPVEAP